MSNPITKRLGIYPIIKVEEVEKLACSRAPGGFLVSYRPHINVDYPEGLKRYMTAQPSFASSMFQALTAQVNGPHGTQEGRFELSERGWWCPSMRDDQHIVQILRSDSE
jgi:hypothetical protein